jgi:hypothetical protein
MNFIKLSFQKILSFLRLRSIAGGLEVSDQVLRLVYYNGKAWQMAAIRLAPGVMEKGVVKNIEAFIASLRELKTKIPVGRDRNKKMNVVMSLSSVNIYSQIFTLPILEGDELEKAIDLNVQMLSPVDSSEAYSGWQLMGRDEVNYRLEISAAFVNKKIVDDMVQLLFTAGFLTVGVESRALALVRILREKGAGVDIDKSYLLLNIDNSGIDFLVVRKGHLYFEYTNQWADIADEKGQIPVDKFEETMAASFRQVTNFYTQHWPEPLSAVILSATAFADLAEKAIQSAGVPIIRLSLFMGQSISSEWLVALGCSLRELKGGLHSKEINLSGEGAMDTFRREQLLHFLNFWRVFVPIVLVLLIGLYVAADNFLVFTASSIESQPGFTQGGGSLQQVVLLEASSTQFNNFVALLQNVQGLELPKNPLISTLNNMAIASNIVLNHVSLQTQGGPVLAAGTAQSESDILAFKNSIEADHQFGAVSLPLSGVQFNNQVYSFSMTFPFSPSAAQ